MTDFKYKNNMQFHEPDIRWESFGCPNFDAYLERYFVKGNFHGKVPQAILDAYTTIEFIMAHAYYHYPMYDEALSKLLRTIEMATKLRCKELDIELEYEVKKNDKTTFKKKDFNRLIQDLIKKEPDKQLDHLLEVLRHLRNSFMHPSANSYAGGMYYIAIVTCVTAINSMFTEETSIKLMIDRYRHYNSLLLPFHDKALVLEMETSARLIHHIAIPDTIVGGKDEIISLFLQPVGFIKNKDKKNNAFIPPMSLDVKNIKISENDISGIDLKTNESFIIYITNDLQNIKANEDYKTYLRDMSQGNFSPYEVYVNSKLNRAISKFRYRYYHLL